MTAQPKPKNLELSVANFGPIARANIDLRPMTVFVGPSNTGKSYLAILIYALHRFFGGRPFGLGFKPSLQRHSIFEVNRTPRGHAMHLLQEEIDALVGWMEGTLKSDTEQMRRGLHQNCQNLSQDWSVSGSEMFEVSSDFSIMRSPAALV